MNDALVMDMRSNNYSRNRAAKSEKPGSLTRATWYMLIFSLPFADFLFFPETMKTAGQPSTFLVLGLWLVLFVELALKRGVRLPNDRVHRPLFWFLAVALASIVMCYWVPVPESLGDVVWEKSIRQLAHFGLFASLFLLPYFLIRSRKEFDAALRVFFLAVLVVLAYGVLELATAFLGIHALGAVLEAFHWGSWYVVPGDVPGIVMSSTPLGELPRLRLVFAEPSMAANFLAVAFPLLTVRALSRRGQGQLWAGLAFLAALCLLLTFSLGGYLFFLATSTLLIVLLPGSRRRLHYGVLLGAFMLFLLAAPLVRDFAVGVLTRPLHGELSVAVRLESAEAGLRMLWDYPLLGVGIGNTPFYVYDYLPWRPRVAHYLGWYMTHGEIALPVLNLFVRMLAETGLVGGLLFMLWHYRILESGWETIKVTTDSNRKLLGIGLFVASVGVLLGYSAEGGFDKRYWPFILGMCVAWVRVSRGRVLPAKETVPGRFASSGASKSFLPGHRNAPGRQVSAAATPAVKGD
ncbi:MAG: O-antigen ligase family protein [Terriglobia bacterium]